MRFDNLFFSKTPKLDVSVNCWAELLFLLFVLFMLCFLNFLFLSYYEAIFESKLRKYFYSNLYCFYEKL